MITRIARINNDFLKYALYRVYSLKSQLIIMIMCGVLTYPLIAFALSLQFRAEELGNHHGAESSFLIISGFICVVAAVVFMLLVYTAGINCYDYYNRRERVDLSWSLPIKRRDRFWGDFAAGLVPLVLTYIISAAVGFLIVNIGFPENIFGGLQADAMKMIAAALFAGLLTIFSVFIISVFCAAICGRVYETAAYPALIMAIIPAIIGLFGIMIFNNVWQINIYSQLETVLGGTSPGGFLAVFVSELTRHNGENLARHITFLNPAVIIPFILVNGGFLTGAYYLAKRRGAEKTGNSFVVRGALEIIMALVVFCIASLFFISAANSYEGIHAGIIFGLIVTTAIAFLMLDVSAKRGFKKMGRAGIKYALMLICSTVIASLLLAADGFGIGKYVPRLENIQSAQFEIDFLDNHQQIGHSWEPSVFTSGETIALIRELHIASNQDPRNNEADYVRFVPTRHFEIGGTMQRMQQTVTYTLNNGNTVTRNIRVYQEQLEQLLPLIISDDYKNMGLRRMDNWFTGKQNVQATAEFMTFYGGFDSRAGRNVTPDAIRLYEAFKADYTAETFEQRFHSTERVLGHLRLNFEDVVTFTDDFGSIHTRGTSRTRMNVYVFAHYTNLIAELERQGFSLSGELPMDWQPPHMTLYKAEYIGANVETADVDWWNWSGNRHQSLDFLQGDEMRGLVKILFDVMQPSYVIQGEGYLLQIQTGRFGGYFVIPPEYNHIAEELAALARRAQAAADAGEQRNMSQGYYEDDFVVMYG
jgi:hypothetical protein